MSSNVWSVRKMLHAFTAIRRVNHKTKCRKLQDKQKNNSFKHSQHQALWAEIKNLEVSGYENVWLADSVASKHMTFH